ncbi:MAG: TetR/AcrR family transcriptional regulator [Acidimicrobiales bacterium]
MAKPGVSSQLLTGEDRRSTATRAALIEAAIETLKSVGFAGASARVIAGRAGANQALVFYHFGSVSNLLLAALDAVSAARLERYSAALQAVASPAELVEVAAGIFREDLDAGYVTVLVEVIAGASSTPGLGAEVASRIAPWTTFARQAIEAAVGTTGAASIIPSNELAHGVVALYVGLELLTHLDGNRRPALALFERAKQLATLLGGVAAPGAGATAAAGKQGATDQ